jgi:hypothetical protein
MNMGHYLLLAVVLIAGYFIGSKYPGLITKVSGGIVSA